MSTIADYSILTKAFLASDGVDFSKLYTQEDDGSRKAFAVVPLAHSPHLTTREALNFDTSSWTYGDIKDLISCHDANGKFIGNIVRIQPGVREGSIRLVAKVAVPATSGDVADASYNTFVLLRAGSPTNVGADFSTNVDLPIAVATISKGYTLHKHLASEIDPLDDVENATYVSFTINNLNGYTSVDFNPDAYATYDDVENALSRGIDGLHIAFDNASGDLKLLDKDGNVLDQANLPIKADVIIADGEEGYKYVKTDVKQDIHAAKAWMPKGFTAWEDVPPVGYIRQHAALVVDQVSTPTTRVFKDTKSEYSSPISTEPVPLEHVVIGDSIYMVVDKTETNCNLIKVNGNAEAQTDISNAVISNGKVTHGDHEYPITNGDVEVNVVKDKDGVTTRVLVGTKSPDTFRVMPINGRYSVLYIGTIETSGGSSADRVLGITPDGTNLYTFDEGAQPHSEINNISGGTVRWLDRKPITDVPNHTLKYGLEAFVWTVKDREVKLNEPFFQQLNNSLLDLGFHEGDDIALGTNLPILAPTEGVSPLNGVDAEEYIHGKDNKAIREQEVDAQRANAKEELVAWNAQRPTLTENRHDGTIIDHKGLDVRNGSITLGCGHVGEAGVYGIQMNNDSSASLDFTISRTTGEVQFDADGHATNLTSSTLLSIEPSSYISGAPTCLILAKVEHNLNPSSEGEGPTRFTPIRMTAGFSVAPSYGENGLTLMIQDLRENIKAILNHDDNTNTAPSIIEVQAIYTHQDARNVHETVPAQQMHTYIGEWDYHQIPTCSFLCNKIEEWMTAVGLADPEASTGVELYVVIRVY